MKTQNCINCGGFLDYEEIDIQSDYCPKCKSEFYKLIEKIENYISECGTDHITFYVDGDLATASEPINPFNLEHIEETFIEFHRLDIEFLESVGVITSTGVQNVFFEQKTHSVKTYSLENIKVELS